MIVGDRPQAGANDLPAVAEIHEKVVQLTERLFQHPATIRRDCDPEIPLEYFVVETPVAGEVDDIVRRHHEWHAALGAVAGEQAEHYRLSLHPQ
jgi:hypothetical protein